MFPVEVFGEVDIPDQNLRTVIEQYLGKRSGAKITADEIATLRSIKAKWRNIRDLTGLEYAVNLDELSLGGNPISDLSPLAGLVRLNQLSLEHNRVSDLSPLSGLLNLRGLYLENNLISDLSPLAGLVRLENLRLDWNAITDVSALTGLISLRDLQLDNNFISDLSPLLANSGLGAGDKIVLFDNPLSDDSLNKHIPALRRKGVYVNIATLITHVPEGLRIGDEFTYDVRIEDVSSLSGWEGGIRYSADALELLSVTFGSFLGWGNNVEAYPGSGSTLDAASMTIEMEGDRNWARGLSQVRLNGGVSGNGTLLSCQFRIIGAGKVYPLADLQLFTVGGSRIDYHPSREGYWISASVDVNGDGQVDLADVMAIAPHIGTDNDEYDVDGNGRVNVADMIYVVQRFGPTPRSPSAVSDMALLEGLTPSMVKEWIDMAHAADDGSEAFRKGIATFNRLLEMITPKETVLLPNYPNPFNPETWIPYELAHAADVTITIYDIKGAVVRQLDLGHQAAGYYTTQSKAAYWDGRNERGESVASGVYFYQLWVSSSQSIGAENYSKTRRMVILK